MRPILSALLFALLLSPLGLVSTPVFAQGSLAGLTQQATEFLPVDEAYHLEVEQLDQQTIRLYWQITDSYYLYQHRFKATLTDGQGSVGAELSYSPGLAKSDEFFGDVEVYYNYADLKLHTERAFGQARLAVTSQGCADAGLCYPPNTEVFTIDGDSGSVTRGEPAALTGPSLYSGSTNADGTQSNPTQGASQKSASTQAGSERADSDPAEDSPASVTLLAAMGFAFLGGLILNAMPCVFPILSLKVLRFATGDPAEHHRHAWWYLTGVVVSFVAIATVLIMLQQGGQLIGWGFQLQSPGFVIALAYLFTAMGLSLSGVVHFGAGMMNLGNALAGQGGNQGSFFTGVLAVVVASPCTAPFMGSALGYALTQPALIALLVFVALGVGMAFPMVLLSYSATARRALPKPGPWMDTLKQLIAFPLYATAVWLLWVAGKQAGVDAMAAALGGLVALSLALFLYQGSALRRVTALIFLAIAIALGTVRGEPNSEANAGRAPGTTTWSPEALAGLLAEGRPVFVDVTADWCITCLANEQAVLFTDATRAAFEQAGVVYMVADWTNYDPSIGEFVKSHGRNGIPLYVMYPVDDEPFLLPQLLTRATIDAALAQVARN